MANPYFRNLPEFEYVNRTQRGRSEGDYSVVKNFFKRGKLREDIFQDITFFTKYIVQGDDRPDTVASKVYDTQLLIGLFSWQIISSTFKVNGQCHKLISMRTLQTNMMRKHYTQEYIIMNLEK